MLPPYLQLEPPKKSFMEQAGWPIITGVATSIIVFALTAWIIKVQVIDFTWAMLVFGCITLGTTVYIAVDNMRTKQKLQEQYQKERAAMNADSFAFKNEMRQIVTDGIARLEDWKINFANANAKEQKKHFEQLEYTCMEAIHDAEQRLDITIKNAQSLFKGAVESQQRAVELYAEQLIYAQKQMTVLEERLRKDLQPDTTRQASETGIPPA
jgi:hypothetical protein